MAAKPFEMMQVFELLARKHSRHPQLVRAHVTYHQSVWLERRAQFTHVCCGLMGQLWDFRLLFIESILNDLATVPTPFQGEGTQRLSDQVDRSAMSRDHPDPDNIMRIHF